MKILLIIPGSGDMFYCSNCFRDHLYAQSLRNAGHNVIVMPLYLPLTDQSFHADTPLFFPATSYYVAQKYFDKGKTMPRILEKILDSSIGLQLASSFSGTTSAKGMEQMTLSMIKGDDRNFTKEIEKIIRWINHAPPDIIHLSSSLLIGIAKAIKSQIDIPVVCSLQDEEIWIDSLKSPFDQEAWETIAHQSKFIDRFITSSEFYKSAALNKIPEIGEIAVVCPGVNIKIYESHEYPKYPTIGFYYRMNYENGLDILAQAFVQLKRENTIPHLKLKIGGGYTRENKNFLNHIRNSLKAYTRDVIWSNHYSLDEHATFYKNITLICTPLRFSEAVGLYLCEAFAAGRPAIVPNTGSFSEIVENAGSLYFPNDSEHLAEAIKKVLTNNTLYEKYRENALRLSQEKYNETITSDHLSFLYQEQIDKYRKNRF